MSPFSCRPLHHTRTSICHSPSPRGYTPMSSPFVCKRSMLCQARAQQVMVQQEDSTQNSFFRKFWRTVVLVPALGAALIGCNRSLVHNLPPSLPEVQVSSARDTATVDSVSPYASVSITSGAQKAHVHALAGVSAAILLLGFQASKKKNNRKDSSLSALDPSAHGDAVGSDRQFPGNTKLPLRLGNWRRNVSSVAEARPQDIKWQPTSKSPDLAQEPTIHNRPDFVDVLLRGKWQKENQTLDNLPGWDPISALHAAAGSQDKAQLCKYDLLGSLLSHEAEGSTDNNSSSNTIATFDSVPGWDPVSGIRSAARSTDKNASNRYDFLEDVLRGNWQSEISQVEKLPAWDPISGLVNIARDKGSRGNSKFDIMSSVLQGEWQAENSSLKNLPSWDPTGKLIQVATNEEDPVEHSKYDAAAGLLSLGNKTNAPNKSIAKKTEAESLISVGKATPKQEPEDLEKNNILQSITLLMKELESVQEVDTLKV